MNVKKTLLFLVVFNFNRLEYFMTSKFVNFLVACFFFVLVSSPAMAEEKLLFLGDQDSIKLSEYWFSFFHDKGLPYETANIKDFDNYKDKKTIFVVCTINENALDNILGSGSSELKKSRSMKSSLYNRIDDKFSEGQNIFVFAGASSSRAFAISEDMETEWWPVLAGIFDIPLMNDELFAY